MIGQLARKLVAIDYRGLYHIVNDDGILIYFPSDMGERMYRSIKAAISECGYPEGISNYYCGYYFGGHVYFFHKRAGIMSEKTIKSSVDDKTAVRTNPIEELQRAFSQSNSWLARIVAEEADQSPIMAEKEEAECKKK